MRRGSGLFLLLALALPGRSAVAGPLPGETVTRIGQVAAIPADQRTVPGFAGAWRSAATQGKVLDWIKGLQARATPACRDIRVIDTRQAAPDLIENGARPAHHALESWEVEACGATVSYDVWYRFQKDASRLVVIDAQGADFQSDLDPPYRRLRELAEARRIEEASGKQRWLNLPLPPDTVPVANRSDGQGWSADFAPLGETVQDWTQLVSVQGLPRVRGTGQAVTLLEGMQKARAARCGVPAGEVELLPPGSNAPHGVVVRTYLLCPQVPGTNYAEMAVVKAIEGPDWLYVVQRAWRLPADSAEAVRSASREPREAAEAFLTSVQLCDPARERSACPAPFPH